MAYCPVCGAVNSEDALKCAACDRILAIICSHCSSRNAVEAMFCSSCGRALDLANSQPKSLPETEAVSPNPFESAPQKTDKTELAPSSDLPPRGPFLRLVLGCFAFAFLYLTQALSGYPLLAIVAGFIAGLVALWGTVELCLWALERYEAHRPEKVTDNEANGLVDPLPAPLPPDTGPLGGSFEELDREARPAQPKGLVSSMVADMPNGGIDELTKPHRRETKQSFEKQLQSGLQAEQPNIQTPEKPEFSEVLAVDLESVSDAPKREKVSQTLAEFLNDGIEQEMEIVRKKLVKHPDSYPLKLRLAQLQEERGDLNNAVFTMSECVKSEPSAPEVYLYYGFLLRRTGKFDEARKTLQNALELNPYLAKAYYQLGSLERAVKRYTEAREALQKCIQLTPDDPYAHYQLGMVYKEQGDLHLAQLEIERACMLHPSDSYGHSRLGQLYHSEKKLDRAVFEYSQALSLKPNDPYVLEKLADVMIEKGEHSNAAELLQEALSHQFHPDPQTMIKLGRVMLGAGRHHDIVPLMNEVLRVSPKNADAMFLLAQAYIAEQNYEKAEAALQELLAASPDRAEAWLELGKLYQTTGKDEEALMAFTKATPNAIDQAGVWNTIGILLANRRNYPEALKAFRKALSFDYSDSRILTNLKAVQKKLESDCRREIEAAEKALALNAGDIEAYLKIGRAYEMLDKPDDAMMAYQRLLSIKPDSIEGLTAYADLLKARGKLRMAMRCYREILKLQHNHIDARLNIIRGSLALGFINDALRHAVVAQKFLPDDPRIHFLLGKIYFAKGLAPRALREFSFAADSPKADPETISWAELMRRRLQKKS